MTAPAPSGAIAGEGPYVGLDYFAEDKAALFFGRDGERKMIIGNLRASRLTLLYAESGVGKSSLLRAGVAARLDELAQRSSVERGSPRYVPVVFNTWRDDPVATLINHIEATARSFLGPGSNLELPPDGLEEAIKSAAEALDATPLIMLDQFEEFFLYHGETEARERFADGLAQCVGRADVRANFLISIREDAYSRIGDLLKARIPNVYGNYLHLDYLDRRAARDAIVQPIEQVNRSLLGDSPAFAAEPALVEEVLDQVRRGRVTIGDRGRPEADGEDAGRGAERFETAYLQLVMERLWNEETAAESRVLRLETLRRLGGAETIIRTHVDQAIAELAADQRDAAAAAFQFLVTSAGRKIALTTGELSGFSDLPESAVEPALRRLEGKRILRAVAAPERPAHGSHRAGDGAAATRWELFHDILAPPIIDWRRRHVDEQRHLETERELEQQRARARRFRAIAIGLVTLLAIAAAATVLAVRQTQKADRQAQSALSRALAAEALTNLDSDVDLAILLSLEAYHREPNVEARNALLTSIQRSEGIETFLHGHKDRVNNVAFSPDGKTLASTGGGGARLWDFGRRRQIGEPFSAAFDVAFSRDGRTLASAGGDGVRLWDVGRGRPQLDEDLCTGRGRPQLDKNHCIGGASDVAFSRDGKTLASAGGGGVRLWDFGRRRQIGEALRTGAVSGIAFSRDGKTLALAGDGGLRLWDVGRRRQIFGERVPGGTSDVAFSPDGKTLASAGNTGVQLWDFGRRPQLDDTLSTRAAVGVAFSRDGKTLASAAGEGLRLWDVGRRRQISEPLPGAASDVAFSRDGKTLASAGGDDLRLWDVERHRPLDETLPTGAASGVAFSRDGKTLASAGGDGLQLWDVERRPQLDETLPTGAVSGVAFSRDGKTLASAAGDDLQLWDVERRPQLDKTLPTARALGVAFSPDGKTLASAAGDDLQLWDVERRPQLDKTLNSSRASGVAFSPDGKTLASAAGDGVRLWDVERRPPLDKTLNSSGASGVAFSPDGKTLASAGGVGLRLWDVGRRRKLGETLSAARAFGVAFSPDGRTLASAGDDGVRLWDVGGRRQIGATLSTARARGVAFSRDGKIASAGDQLIVWASILASTREEVFANYLCRVVGGRNLTRDEWDFYLPDQPYRGTCTDS